MNTSEILKDLIAQRLEGLEGIDGHKIKPGRIKITSVKQLIQLDSNHYILNTRRLPSWIDGIEFASSDNYFQASPESYDLMDEYRYQLFCDYIDISISYDTEEHTEFKPFFLEFIKVIPLRNND